MSTKSQEAGASSVTHRLREDHRKVKGLFEEFEQAEDAKAKQRIVETALTELEVHSKLEEELIYPTIRGEIDDDDLMDEALEEHHVVHGLIGELRKMKPRDERYDAKFTVLAENVRHHIKEEESEHAMVAKVNWPKAIRSAVYGRALSIQSLNKRNPCRQKGHRPIQKGKAKSTKS